jgi:hypothetical protein
VSGDEYSGLKEGGDEVGYRAKVLVRMRRPWRQWQNWNDYYRGGSELLVRQSRFEVVAGQGMMLSPRHVLAAAADTSMWRDTVGFSGLPLHSRESIVLAAHSNVGRVWLALTCDDMDGIWAALERIGVTTFDEAPSRRWYVGVLGGPLAVHERASKG